MAKNRLGKIIEIQDKIAEVIRATVGATVEVTILNSTDEVLVYTEDTDRVSMIRALMEKGGGKYMGTSYYPPDPEDNLPEGLTMKFDTSRKGK